MLNDQDFKEFHYNVLGAHSKIIGNLMLAGDTIINSHVEGSIEMTGNGKLIIERGSLIKGNIKATDLDVFGTIEGEVECLGLLSIRSSAHVQGSIKSERLVIYPGAIVETNASTEEKNV